MPDRVPSNQVTVQIDQGRVCLPGGVALALEAIAFAKSFDRQLSFEFEAAGLSMTPAEARVLLTVAQNEGLRQTQLAQLLSYEAMTLVGALDRLQAAGLVKREPDESDRRAKRVLLRPPAVPLVRRIKKVFNELCVAADNGLDNEAAKQSRDTLSRMRENLAGLTAGAYPAGRVDPVEKSAANNRECTKEHNQNGRLSPTQCRMARAGLGLSVRELAKQAKVSGLTVTRFENGNVACPDEVVHALKQVLESSGAEFIRENGRGSGVRIRKQRFP